MSTRMIPARSLNPRDTNLRSDAPVEGAVAGEDAVSVGAAVDFRGADDRSTGVLLSSA